MFPPVTPVWKTVWSLQDAFGCAKQFLHLLNLERLLPKENWSFVEIIGSAHISQPAGFRVLQRINYLLGLCLGLGYSEWNCMWVWPNDFHLSQVWAGPLVSVSATLVSHRQEQNLKRTLGAMADGFLPMCKIKEIISTVPRHFFHFGMVILSRPKYS